jgi:transcriptional regulator with XRE-family HTH domain
MENELQVLQEIGRKLTLLRINAGFTSYERFAVEYNISRMAYWKIEKGKTNITMRTLLTILNIHKISLVDFFATKERFEEVLKEQTSKKKIKRS